MKYKVKFIVITLRRNIFIHSTINSCIVSSLISALFSFYIISVVMYAVTIVVELQYDKMTGNYAILKLREVATKLFQNR